MEQNNVLQAEPEAFDFYKMSSLTQMIIEIMLQEGDLLRDIKISEIVKFQRQKHEISTQLEAQQKALRAGAQNQATLTAEQIQQLRKLAKDYEDALIYYQKQYYKAHKVNEITVKMITDTVTEFANRNRGYNHLYSKRKFGHSLLNTHAPAMKINNKI
jgi:hypothetical protein